MKKAIVILFVLLILIISGGFGYLALRIQNIESRIWEIEQSVTQRTENAIPEALQEIEITDTCSTKCQKEISDAVRKAVASITPTVIKTSGATTSLTPKTRGTTYIPMGTTYESTSTSWYTIDDTATYIDLVNDYGSNAKVSWEASLKVAHANGQAFARLWDDTNKIAVDGSELTTINNSDYKLITTGNLPFWKGRNLYKVQIKSLNSFVVSYTGGKIRVSY